MFDGLVLLMLKLKFCLRWREKFGSLAFNIRRLGQSEVE